MIKKDDYINVQDESFHWYYIPKDKGSKFREYLRIGDKCWGFNSTPTEEDFDKFKELDKIFTPMRTGGGPIQ